MPDWLVWQQDNLVATFDRREAHLNAGFNWQITNRQELRLKLQAIGLSAGCARVTASTVPEMPCPAMT